MRRQPQPRADSSTLEADVGSPPVRRTNRRTFLVWTGRLGIGAVGGLASLTATARPAKAYTYGCCHLAKPAGGCPGSGCSFSCPSGYRKRTWGCCTSNGRVMVCGECTTGASCWSGTFKCSEYCVTSAPCN
jgi:hypothetical protein